MSKIKKCSAILVLCSTVVTSFIITNKWRDDSPKPTTESLPLIDTNPVMIKPQAKQHISNSISIAKEKELQRKLDIALATTKQLQREKQVLNEKLDQYMHIDNSDKTSENIGLVEEQLSSQSIEPLNTREQLENRFNQENQDLEWANSVEASITNKYYETLVEGNDLVDARCHSTLCRVEMIHSNRGAQASFWANASGIEGLSTDQLYVQHINNQEEGLKTVIFVSRQGHKISADADL